MLATWSLVPLPFLSPAWTSGSSQLMYCWCLVGKILSITLLVREMSAIVQSFEYSLALPFFRIGMKTDLFQSCGHCWVFQICWHITCTTFTASSFRIWNSSTGIPSPAVTLFVVMLPKTHLISHSWMSGSWWVITLTRCRIKKPDNSKYQQINEISEPSYIADKILNNFSFCKPLRHFLKWKNIDLYYNFRNSALRSK